MGGWGRGAVGSVHMGGEDRSMLPTEVRGFASSPGSLNAGHQRSWLFPSWRQRNRHRALQHWLQWSRGRIENRWVRDRSLGAGPERKWEQCHQVSEVLKSMSEEEGGCP
jgi:arylsulfatase A-like enzyme